MNEIAEKIANYLLEDDFFENFKLRKKDSSLINKLPSGCEMVELQNWLTTSTLSGDRELIVYPVYGKRFDLLHKWFEKFSFKTMSDQRSSYSVGLSGEMLGKNNEYTFSLLETPGVNWESFRTDVVNNAKYVFSKFSTLDDLYEYLVYPLINGDKQPPDVGADWVFEYLLLTRLVDINNYDRIKSIIINQVEKMNNRGEPNIVRYYDNLDEIIDYLESKNILNAT